ncbi:hypothetical protein ACRARG_01985 [Pseudooceanicola sp. C21-150M6]|uniref:hypothetical protein n=1 Tax=Pseudooceanicola sp. C21-150M6 TaxID=3434355 RepID=UPI003D7F68AF
MFKKSNAFIGASLIALMAAPLAAQSTDSPRVGETPQEVQAENASDNFAVQGSTNVDAPRSAELADRSVDVESTNREMGLMKVSDLQSYMTDDMRVTDSPLLGTAVWSSDEQRVGIIGEVYNTPEGDQLALADVDHNLGTVVDQFAIRVANGTTNVTVPMDELGFQNALKSIDGGEGRSE